MSPLNSLKLKGTEPQCYTQSVHYETRGKHVHARVITFTLALKFCRPEAIPGKWKHAWHITRASMNSGLSAVDRLKFIQPS
eukprot:4645592-Pyramimonas_sp.AAC.1